MSAVKHSTIVVNDGGLIKGSSNTIEIKDLTNATTLMTLASNGDVSIPGTLEVNGNPITSSQWIDGAGGDIYYSSGDVGIGITDPQTKLAVNSSDYADGGEWNTMDCLYVGPDDAAQQSAGIGVGYNSTQNKAYIQSVAPNVAWKDLVIGGSNVELRTNGNSAMYLSSSGNIGIGSATPTTTLDVNGNVQVSGYINSNSHQTNIIYAATDLQILPSGGNVGIGLTNPQRKLDIGGEQDTQIAIFSNNDTATNSATVFLSTPHQGFPTNALKTSLISESIGSYGQSKLHFCLSGNDNSNDAVYNASISDARMTIIPSGNVGIGTVNPSEKLDVNGNIQTSGYISAPNVVTSSGDLLLTPSGSNVIINNKNLGVGTDSAGGERLYVLGVTKLDSNTDSTSSTTGALQVTGGVGVSGTTDATSSTNGGALTVAGGLAIAKKSFFGDNMDLGNNLIKNIANPSANKDAANKEYVDTVAQGLSPKQSVRVATTTNGDLSADFEDSDTIDGVTLVTGNRILIKNQTMQTQNGIYVVQASGAPVRAVDFDAPEDNVAGAYVFVQEGTVNADSGWVCITNEPVTFGSSNIVFTQFTGTGSITAGTNIDVTGNQVSVIDNPTFSGDVYANSGTTSTSTTSGALKVTGGAGITGNLYIGGTGNVAGIVNITNGTNSTNSTNGALVINGGIGIGQDISIGGVANIDGGPLFVNSGTTSTSTTSGAIQVTGGAGISENLYVGGTGNVAGILSVTNNTASTSSTSGGLLVSGGVGIAGTTDSSSITNGGALTIAGGLAVAKTARIKDVVVQDSLTYSGMVGTVSLTISNTSNASSTPVVEKARLIKLLGNDRMLCATFSIDPTTSNTTTSFEFSMPDISTNFSSNADVIGNINGIITTDLVNIENCLIYSVSGQQRCKISFTAGDETKTHYVTINVHYTSN